MPTPSKPTLPLSKTADRHILYQRAVQSVDAEIDFVDSTFRTLRKRTARRLREDFCGTANTSCEWVRRRRDNIAVGLDLDAPTLQWGLDHNIARLTPAQRARLTLCQMNVLRGGTPGTPFPHPAARPARVDTGRMDCILAMNFSWWIFQQRATLKKYFQSVRRSLVRDGVFFMDIYGGWEALKEFTERRPIQGGHRSSRGFTYLWQQAEYDPITNRKVCRISFKLRDGSVMKNAFEYEWRIWSVPETIDLLRECGFSDVGVYWEGDDAKGGGNGVFERASTGEACASWIAYIVASK